MTTRIKFIRNPIAGLGKNLDKIRRIIDKAFEHSQWEYDFQDTSGRGDATRIAREAVQEGFDLVVAIGGDGTVNEVASGLVNSAACLGIIPIGSGNGLARGLGIPMNLKKAICLLLKGETREIDVGQADGRYFFVTMGVGFDAIVGKRFDENPHRGPLPYFYLGLKEFVVFQPKKVILKFNDKELTIKPFLVTIANTRQYGNRAIIAPQAKPDDGLFDICIAHEIGFIQGLYHLPKLFIGRIHQTSFMEMHRSNAIEIIRESPAPFHVDGEPLDGGRELKISLIPKALKVMVPLIKPERSGHEKHRSIREGSS